MNKDKLVQLRRQSHGLKPVVLTGAQGLTDGVHAEIETALDAHELIKIRVNADGKDQRKEMTQTICDQHHAELVQMIGHVIVIYRKNPDQ